MLDEVVPRVADLPEGGSRRRRGLDLGDTPVTRHWHQIMLAYAVFVLAVPFVPVFPRPGLDAGWSIAINQAAIRHLVFGRDIVFTYGPYGAVFTGAYDPGITWMALLGGGLLAIGLLTAAMRVLRCAPRWLWVCSAVLCLSNVVIDEAKGLLYPLLVLEALRLGGHAGAQALGRRRDVVVAAALAAPFGLLPLVKFSSVPPLAVGWLLGMTLLWGRHRRAEFVTFALTPVATALLLWIAAGQPIEALPEYAQSGVEVARGYSEAMSLQPPHSTAPVFALVAAVLLLVEWFGSALSRLERVVTTLMIATTLFVAFKAGYVRDDYLHVYVAVSALLVVGAVVFVHTEGGRAGGSGRFAVVAALLLAVTIGVAYPAYTAWAVEAGFTNSFRDTPRWIVQRVVSPGSLGHEYDRSMRRLAATHPLPRPGDAVDIYSFDQAGLFAAGGADSWDPRPVFQSYSAYTPALAERNADHLRGPGAPRHILFRVQPIDGRLPAVEDGSSWLSMLANYTPTSYSHRSPDMELSRTEVRSAAAEPGPAIELHGRMGEALHLPSSDGGWLARFSVEPSPLGSLRIMLWSPPIVHITVTTDSGATFVYRFLPNMARAAFLLSPLVRKTSDFASIASGGRLGTPPERVTRITLSTSDGSRWWQSEYRLTLRKVSMTW